MSGEGSDNDSWQSADCLSDELFSYCQSEMLSEDGLREIIEHNNDQHDVRDYEFFRMACCNEKVTEEIIRCLLEYFPDAISDADNNGKLPLHAACLNNYVTIGIIQLLVDAAPDSVRHQDNAGLMALHHLCRNIDLDEMTVSPILKLLLVKNPESIYHANNDGLLPIHVACMVSQSTEFCRMIIEAFPYSVRMPTNVGMLPIHTACVNNTVTTVEYLYKLYPDAINHASTHGLNPIHAAIMGLDFRFEQDAAVKVVQFLLGCDTNVKFQEALQGESLLHYACRCEYNKANTEIPIEIIKVLHEANPEFVRKEDSEGRLPLHKICSNTSHDETAAFEILKLLLAMHPESIRHANKGQLPIHIASMTSKSREFCRVLIEAYPGSERMTNVLGMLPIHCACVNNTVATVEYLYKLNPDAVNHVPREDGLYPVHLAISSIIHRTAQKRANLGAIVGIVKFLLGCDPRVKFQKIQGAVPPLACACFLEYNDTNIGAAIDVIELIYDAHPEAIEDDAMDFNEHNRHQQVQEFIINQLVYSHQARDHLLMTTPDDNGQLPLHKALHNNVRLGSIKLLVKGNPPALQTPDNSGSLPLHIACAYHDSASVVQYLIGLDSTTLDVVDHDNNTALHYACRGAKYETIAMLLEEYDAVSVSKRNAQKKLPIDLLWESNSVEDRESVEYTESVFRLLTAYPELMMNCM
eukprot:scaffold3907_cov76-Skeletonema_dohrnii-CCMP3373.AAC.5